MKNKKKINYKILTIIIVVAVIITAVLAFLFIKNKNVIVKQGEKEGELLQASYTGTISTTLFGASVSVSYEANEYNNNSEDSNFPYWYYFSLKIGSKKFNYKWLGGKCRRAHSTSTCLSDIYYNYSFASFSSNGNRYIVVKSSPKVVNNTAYAAGGVSPWRASIPPYTATVFLEKEDEYQMIFEVPTPRYVQFDLSTSNYGNYDINYNFAVNTSLGYVQYLAMSTTSGKVDVHRVYFNGSNVSDTVVGQESGSIKMS